MLPTSGMKQLKEKLERAMLKSGKAGENFAEASHRTYEMTAQRLKTENVLSLYHYGTRILTVSYNVMGHETVEAKVYSSSDRNAINALLIVLELEDEYKFNINGENVLKGGK